MLVLYKPEYADLWFRKLLLADDETMSYNRAWGGAIDFPEPQWADWYDYWIVRHEGKRFYRYLKEETGAFVGEIAYHFDADVGGHMADVIVYSRYRGRGYGAMGLDMLCAAAKKNGVSVLWDDIAADNPAADMFLRHGFVEEYRTDEKIWLAKRL